MEGQPIRDDTPRVRCRQARLLRRNMTVAEEMLWRSLRGHGFEGMKFRRQAPIGHYIADFACLESRIIVELDGRPHEAPERQARDRRRDEWFAAHGWRVLRLDNERIIGGAALLDIAAALRPHLLFSPHPSIAPYTPLTPAQCRGASRRVGRRGRGTAGRKRRRPSS